MIPWGTRSLGSAPGCSRALLRRSTHYKDLEAGQAPFTAGDLISLAALYARSRRPQFSYDREFYEGAYKAVCKGLGIDPVNDLSQVLGIDPDREEETRRISDEFFRRAGIGRFMWARGHMISLQDPWGNVMEGDIWGQRSFKKDTLQYVTISRGIEAYMGVANTLPSTIEHLDNALCALIGWDHVKSVSYEDLREKHGMPEAESDF